jgi:hypothetical protein
VSGAAPAAGPPGDTDDLRSGVPVHDALLAVLPMVGTWTGDGAGVTPDGEHFAFGQELSFVHDGRPFLAYRSRAWIRAVDGMFVRPAWRESGFWRVGPGPDDLEVVLASNTGQALMYTGVAGDQRWEIATASAVPAPTAKVVDAERRFYAVVGGELQYATELAPGGGASAPHLNAVLSRTPRPT